MLVLGMVFGTFRLVTMPTIEIIRNLSIIVLLFLPYFRIGHFKLLVGNPGIPDGHIEPDTISGMDPNLYEDICQGTRDKERSKSLNEYEIGGKEIHLFNITGI